MTLRLYGRRIIQTFRRPHIISHYGCTDFSYKICLEPVSAERLHGPRLSQTTGRALYLPEGRYMVNRTLVVGCATPAEVR